MSTLTIGQAAKRAGAGVETIRFYEREGLIDEPPRRPSGYRQYPSTVVARLRFIRTAKDLGFTLKEIRELLALRVDSRSRCGDVKRLAEIKIAGIEARIKALQRMRRTLRGLTRACEEGCACERTNPQGRCCLSNVAALVRDMLQGHSA